MTEPQVDLSPRQIAARRNRSKWPMVIILVILVATVVGLLWFLVTNTSSFKEADDAVADRDEQGDERFSLLGSPLETVEPTSLDGFEATAFTVAFDGVKVDVINIGTPAAQFQEGVPVVLEGHWVQGASPHGQFVDGANDGWYFKSDRMLVKHDNDYREDRIVDAEERGKPGDAGTEET